MLQFSIINNKTHKNHKIKVPKDKIDNLNIGQKA